VEFLSFDIESNDFRRAGAASRAIKEHLKRVGATPEAVRRAMIAAYEAEMNVVIHSVGGRMEAALTDSRLDVNVIDEGPGIPDVELAMTEGFSTASPEARALGFGAGMGLPNIKRNSDRLRVTSHLGEGTRVSFTILLRPAVDDGEAGGQGSPLSLYASADRCRDCGACLTACPTQALRVRESRPSVLEHLCIECTDCVAACSSQALGMPQDCPSLADLEDLAETVLVVPAGLLAGCGPSYPPESVLDALRGLGFAQVVTVEPFVDALRRETLALAANAQPGADVGPSPLARPLILPSCPAVTNLLQLRYPSLLPQLAPFFSPWEALALSSKGRRLAFVVSCPAQRSALLCLAAATGLAEALGAPQDGSQERSLTLEFLLPDAVRQAALVALSAGRGSEDQDRISAATAAITAAPGSAGTGPEPKAALRSAAPDSATPPVAAGVPPGLLTVTGLRHVLAVLEQMEDGLLPDVTVLELYACHGGCFGSPLLTLDHHLSSYRWQQALAETSAAGRTTELAGPATGAGVTLAAGAPFMASPAPPAALPRSQPLAARPGIRLDSDMGTAIRKLGELQALIRALPGRDCGVCGAPTCAALAEDIVRDRGSLDLCPYLTPDREEVDQ
jgi:serine/threonine-protein kinase RsbT